SSLELKVTGSEMDWTNTLTKTDFTNLPATLNDASTADLNSWFVMDGESGEVRAMTAEDSGYYINLPVSIRKAKTGVDGETAPIVKFDGYSLAVNTNTSTKVGLNSALRFGYNHNSAVTIVANSNDAQIKGHSSKDVIADLTSISTASGDAEILLASSGDYWQADVVFYIWVEGTDSACIDGNSGVDVAFTTAFKTSEA
ncbi:MAG: hypothetical protein ACI39E_06920, partial [Acutalibacteraceae bacterium]